MKRVIVTLSIAALLSGCQATQRQNATTGETETNSATKGALAGMLAGAAIGAATGDSSDALRGAAIGGVVGGGAGYYMDKQEQALRQQLVSSGVQVKRINDKELQLVMENGIGFDSGSYHLSSGIYPTLNSVALVLGEYPDTRLEIKGHTDSSGNDASNQTLSEQRAQSVGNYLIGQQVASGRVVTQGYGERYPVCGNDTKAGRACNRRVEINILALN
ncbi:OmpA family protein [Vibrio gigantis]|uniref:OmpA family protein n=1 Tax=Vibrio sp. TMPB1044 TaxID=3051822 RepID=UPI00255B87DC|nr:OmpA family protein [Vibrio sp. TMPB1044]MDL5027150.1 OmpA family protein [Vibrio sp. TMPB1044]MDN5207278.1 OmpA family protein [Vibrio sp. TMPB1044]